jgi:hypothetical protein
MVAWTGHLPENLNTESKHLNIKAIERPCVFLKKNTKQKLMWWRQWICVQANTKNFYSWKRHKLAYYWHVTRHDSLSKTILQGTVNGSRRKGGQRITLTPLKNGQVSVFPLYCVFLRGETTGGLSVVMHLPWHPYEPLNGLWAYDDDHEFQCRRMRGTFC